MRPAGLSPCLWKVTCTLVSWSCQAGERPVSPAMPLGVTELGTAPGENTGFWCPESQAAGCGLLSDYLTAAFARHQSHLVTLKWAIKFITFTRRSKSCQQKNNIPTCKQNSKDSVRERGEMALASLGQLLPLKLRMPLVWKMTAKQHTARPKDRLRPEEGTSQGAAFRGH